MLLENINSYNEIKIEEADAFFIFDEKKMQESVTELISKENKKDIFIMKKLNLKSYIYMFFEKIYKKCVVIINLNDNYKFCKRTIKSLIRLLENNPKCDIKYYIIPNNSKYYVDVVNCIKAIHISDKKKKYNYIYDIVCDFLDTQFSKCDFCDFKNYKCIANRNNSSKFKEMGCCHSFEYASVFSLNLLENVKICEYLKNKKCSTKNISCKLFTCGYLKKKKIKFNTRNILLLDCFFNYKQHDVIQFNFFKSKEEILEKLLEENHSTYIWYLIKREYMINRKKLNMISVMLTEYAIPSTFLLLSGSGTFIKNKRWISK